MGKTLKVKDFDLKFGQDDHKIDVFSVFKEEKRGDILVIYCDRADENKDTLHYASAHLDKDSLVFIDIKNKAEIVKEFTWKLLNNKEKEGFELVDISKYDKVQIVSSNELLLKTEVIKKLYDMNIPKEEDKYAKRKKRISSSTKILLTGFMLTILVIGCFILVNRDFILGINVRYTCTNSYLDEATGANKQDIERLTFDFNDKILSRNIIIRYTFDDEEAYRNYINEGTYYQYQPVFTNSAMLYESNDEALSIDVIEEVKIDEFYNGKDTKDSLINELTTNNYHCVEEASEDNEFLSFLWK